MSQMAAQSQSRQKKLQTLQLQQKKMGCGTSVEDVTQNTNMSVQDLYKRQKLIGVGNHGCVYKGIHQLNHKEYAVKVIKDMECKDRSIFCQQRYADTISKFKALKHRNIVDYQYAELSGKDLSIVMEIAKGSTLKKYIQKDGKMTQQIASGFLQQILEGVSFLHQANILHKDIKTSNIMMSDSENIKLSDYGFAELYDPRLLAKDGKIKECKKNCQFFRGDSLPYMAPEVILNHGITEASDVWSIGCVAIQMLTGMIPWKNIGNTFEEAFAKIRNSTFPPFPSELSKQCSDFLKVCLSINPAKRWKAGDLLNHPFINKNSSSQLFFQISNDSNTLRAEKDKTNRLPSHSSTQEKKKGILKTPGKSQCRYGNENTLDDNYHTSKSSRIRTQNNSDNHYKQSNRSVPRITAADMTTISKEDILPQINEDDEEVNMVMVNNKKVKMRSPKEYVQQYKGHLKTQPIQQKQIYCINLSEADGMNNSFEDGRGLGKKVDTEPSLLISDANTSKDYFKKPLKLLKKKLQQNKRKYINSSFTNQSSGVIEGNYATADRYVISNRKIRTNTENSKEETVINTSYAQAERNRYMNEQQFMKKQRLQEKAQWEQQLKKEAQNMRKEFAMRYAYPYPSITQ